MLHYLPIIIMYILFASTFTLGKAALAYIAPLLFISCRMIFAGSLLLAYSYIKEKKNFLTTHNNYWLFAQIILFHIFFAYNFEFLALTHIASATVCLAYNLSPFFSALFAYVFFNETLSKKQIAGLIVGFLGFIPLFFPELVSAQKLSHYDLLLVLAVASSAYGWIIMKQLMNKGYSFIFINGVAMFGGGLLTLIASYSTEHASLIAEPVTNSIMAASFYGLLLIGISNILCYNLYGYLLMRYSPTLLSFFGLLTPLFAALFGLLFLHETVSFSFFLTLFTLFFGLYLFSNKRSVD